MGRAGRSPWFKEIVGIIWATKRCQIHPQHCNPVCHTEVRLRWTTAKARYAGLLQSHGCWRPALFFLLGAFSTHAAMQHLLLGIDNLIACASAKLRPEPPSMHWGPHGIERVAHVKPHSGKGRA